MTMQHQVIILRGLPGSGKSTLANHIKRVSYMPSVHICSADDFMVDHNGEYHFDPKRLQDCHNSCFKQFQAATLEAIENSVQGEYTIILDNTNTQYSEYDKYIEHVKAVNALLSQLGSSNRFFVTSVIVENFEGHSSVHDVPENTITAMKERFEINLDPDNQPNIWLEEQDEEHPPYEEDECVGCGNLYNVHDPHCECTDRDEQAESLTDEEMQDSIDPDHDA